ncbi:PmoA family protein [Herbidospora mongoliensis]|uniref:DUF6807 domain-containing protein n=1 Tax=Herbidospora mongoliensis TaxID=688067 RepID=UPI0008366343|nr:PmoA family protein [Herbidospora mongoliensis]
MLEVTSDAGWAGIFHTGSPTPIVVQNASPDTRPYIHPIVVPGGTAAITEDAPGHHPWQHGLYVGLNDVNGIGFWLEGLRPAAAPTDGTFHPRLRDTPKAEGNRAWWSVATEYRHPDGSPMMRETQDWLLTDHGDRYDLDVVLTFHAEVALTFGEYPYGGLFLRMPYRKETGGHVVNSEGLEGPETEQQRARWVAVRMEVPGHTGETQVAMMDHPGNLEHPVPWRVDNELGVAPSACVAGAWSVEAGSSRAFRHRLAVFAAPVDTTTIDEIWTAFAR